MAASQITARSGVSTAPLASSAVLGGGELPVQFEVIHQVLPAVAETYKPNGTAREAGAAAHDKMEISPLRAEQFHGTDFATPSRIPRTVSRNVRRKQGIQLQFALKRLVKNLEAGMDQKHWS